MDFSMMFNRVIRAATLDEGLFKEVEADASLNQEALVVVILVSLAGAFGSLVSGVIGRGIGAALLGFVGSGILGVVNYYIWSYVTYFIGENLFDAQVTPGEMLRVLGYSYGPRALSILSFIPCLGWLVALAGSIWALVAGFIGTREALDLDTGKTLITVIIGWVIILVINLIFQSVIGLGALGAGAAASFLN